MKKVIAAFIAGALFATTTTVFADKISNIGKKVTSEYVVKLDGEELPVKAIAFEGTSYAPVRVISEALGLGVDFINKEVILSSPTEEGAGVVEEKVVNKEEFNSQLNSLQIDRNVTLIKLSAAVSVLDNHEKGVYVLSDTELTKQKDLKAKYEKQISDIDQQIDDLKAKYPEFAESSK